MKGKIVLLCAVFVSVVYAQTSAEQGSQSSRNGEIKTIEDFGPIQELPEMCPTYGSAEDMPYFEDPYDCNCYYVCDRWRRPMRMCCPQDLWWHPMAQTCTYIAKFPTKRQEQCYDRKKAALDALEHGSYTYFPEWLKVKLERHKEEAAKLKEQSKSLAELTSEEKQDASVDVIPSNTTPKPPMQNDFPTQRPQNLNGIQIVELPSYVGDNNLSVDMSEDQPPVSMSPMGNPGKVNMNLAARQGPEARQGPDNSLGFYEAGEDMENSVHTFTLPTLPEDKNLVPDKPHKITISFNFPDEEELQISREEERSSASAPIFQTHPANQPMPPWVAPLQRQQPPANQQPPPAQREPNYRQSQYQQPSPVNQQPAAYYPTYYKQDLQNNQQKYAQPQYNSQQYMKKPVTLVRNEYALNRIAPPKPAVQETAKIPFASMGAQPQFPAFTHKPTHRNNAAKQAPAQRQQQPRYQPQPQARPQPQAKPQPPSRPQSQPQQPRRKQQSPPKSANFLAQMITSETPAQKNRYQQQPARPSQSQQPKPTQRSRQPTKQQNPQVQRTQQNQPRRPQQPVYQQQPQRQPQQVQKQSQPARSNQYQSNQVSREPQRVNDVRRPTQQRPQAKPTPQYQARPVQQQPTYQPSSPPSPQPTQPADWPVAEGVTLQDVVNLEKSYADYYSNDGAVGYQGRTYGPTGQANAASGLSLGLSLANPLGEDAAAVQYVQEGDDRSADMIGEDLPEGARDDALLAQKIKELEPTTAGVDGTTEDDDALSLDRYYANLPDEYIYGHCAVQPNPAENLTRYMDFTWGSIDLRQSLKGGPTEIRIDITGFNKFDNDTLHGFHVHEFGDLSAGCESAGGHYDPFGVVHGGPEDDPRFRHFGDLGNVQENTEGEVLQVKKDYLVSLLGPFSVLGRAIVVHEKEDDIGRGQDEGSLLSGNAGVRLGCCTVGLSNGTRWQDKEWNERWATIELKQAPAPVNTDAEVDYNNVDADYKQDNKY